MSRHCRPSCVDEKSVTSSAALVRCTRSGMVWMGSPRTRKKGMLSAASLGAMDLRPRSMKPNWRAPAWWYDDSCRHMHALDPACFCPPCMRSRRHRGGRRGAALMPASCCCSPIAGGARTRLKATATGTLLLAAIPIAWNSAQLSTERWSRDILHAAEVADAGSCSTALHALLNTSRRQQHTSR